jgi:DNA-binding NarL/FixJ family response regulator
MSEPLRVMVTDDNDDLRIALELLIDNEPDMRCVATTAVLDEVMPMVEKGAVEVLVLDLELRGGSSVPRLGELLRRFPTLGIVVHSGHDHPELVRRVRAAGASAYVRKSGDISELLAAIRAAASRPP